MDGDQPHMLMTLTSMPKGEFVCIVVLELMKTKTWCYLSCAYVFSGLVFLVVGIDVNSMMSLMLVCVGIDVVSMMMEHLMEH